MSYHLFIVSRIRREMSRFADFLANWWRKSFYLYLAAIFTVFAVLDTAFLQITSEMRTAAFDPMVRHRIAPAPHDPDIVIIDISEASLAAMSKEYGRWPWPRQVLGEFLENIEKQQPQAVVFDILFSDADVFNPDSDAYFDAAIASTDNAFFPMLRLDPANDGQSQIKVSQIPGVKPSTEEEPQPDATMSIILPHFQSAVQAGRLGTHNVALDADGVLRRYPAYLPAYGWQVPSLPTRIGREFGWQEPSTEHLLLNWRGKPFTYPYVDFAEVYFDMGSKVKKRPQDEFKNKIVLIGSTAAGLYDLRATPMSRMHPGVEVLATAIDNYKHGDSLRFPEGRIWYLLITLIIVWATAWAFYRDMGRDKIDRLFGLSQFLLICITFASINLSNTYINLAGPVTVGLAYFMLARLYAAATSKALEQSMVRMAAERSGDLQATLLLIRLDTSRNIIPQAMLKKMRQELEQAGALRKSVEVMLGDQKGIWNLFENTLAVSWVGSAEEPEHAAQVQQDIDAVLARLQVLLRKNLAYPDNVASYLVHRGAISGGEAASAGWRTLFAEALLDWESGKDMKL